MTLKLLLVKLTPFLPEQGSTTLRSLLTITAAIISQRSVCLNKLKGVIGTLTGRTSTKASSHYQLLTRFFWQHAPGPLWLEVLRLALRLLPQKSRYLILDGTSWERGGITQHYLTLCVLYRGVAIPVLWKDLGQLGASSQQERQELLTEALSYFTLQDMVLLADREYIGTDWFNYLTENGLDFVVRSRDKAYFSLIDRQLTGRTVSGLVAKVARSKKINKAIRIAFRLCPDGPQVWLVIARNPDRSAKDKYFLLITSLDQTAYRTVNDYLRRWQIEHCFRQLKSNGFDLEKINLGSKQRRRLLVAITVLAYVISVVEGLVDYVRSVKVKRHGSRGCTYPAESLFRYGVEKVMKYVDRTTNLGRFLYQKLRKAKPLYQHKFLLNV